MKHKFKGWKEDEVEVDWSIVKDSVYEIIKNTFAASVAQYKMNDQSCRAIYGFDIILNESGQPYLLEVTYCPDLSSISKFRPDFVNQAFGCLFKEEVQSFVKL